jgi:hypothetical protein
VTKLLPGVVASAITGNLDPGSYYPIATTTVPSAGAATVTFSSIPNTYSHLQIRGIGSTTNGTTLDFAAVTFNSDTGANYSWHRLFGDGSTASSSAATSASYIQTFCSGNTGFGPLVLDILDYADINKFKTTRSLSGAENNGSGNEYLLYASGNWRNTNAITSITLTGVFGTFRQYTSYTLYGIKG